MNGVFLENKEVTIATIESPSGRHCVTFKQIGQPLLSHMVKIKVIVHSNVYPQYAEVIEKYINNEGINFSEINWNVEWFDDKVVITIDGFKDEPSVYELYVH